MKADPAGMYILICSDADMCNNTKESALKVATDRLKNGAWPLYMRTRNRRHITQGDECLIYLAGSGHLAQHIFATAKVAEKRNRRSSETVDSQDLLVNPPDQVLELRDIVLIEPIPIRSFLGKLSFLLSKKWGAAFQGGCRRVSAGDAEMLRKHIITDEKWASPII